MLRFLLFLVLFWSCAQAQEEEIPEVLTYLALGDSYTIGHGVPEADRFPVQLAARLQEDGLEGMADPRIVAVTGWSTKDLQTGLWQFGGLKETFSLVSLCIGVNNQYRNMPIDGYAADFDALLDTAIQYAGGRLDRVFVLSIPDYAYTPFGQTTSDPGAISAEIDAFNEVNRTLTEMRGIQYIDITPISRLGLMQPELVAADGLHPSGIQYKMWVDLIFPRVRIFFSE